MRPSDAARGSPARGRARHALPGHPRHRFRRLSGTREQEPCQHRPRAARRRRSGPGNRWSGNC